MNWPTPLWIIHSWCEIPVCFVLFSCVFFLWASMSYFLANQASVCSVKENEDYIDLHKPNSKSKIITVLLYTEAKM